MKNFLLKQLVVWLLIIIGVVIFSLFAYITKGNKSSIFSISSVYKTRLPESKGIYVGTQVTIHGKNTGNVVKITLLTDGQVEVDFSVKKAHTFAITTSSMVQLQNAGALGDRFINIFTPDLSAEKLKKGSLVRYQASTSLVSLLTGSEGGSQVSLSDVVGELNTFLEDLNKKGLSGVFSSEQEKDIDQILKSTKNILRKVETGQGTLGALVNNPSLYNRLLILLGQRPVKNYLKDLSNRSQKKSGKR